MENRENNDFYTVDELASLLRVSPKTVYRYVENHQVPYVRVVRGILFYRDTIHYWLKHQSTNQLTDKFQM